MDGGWMGGGGSDSYAAGDCRDPGMPTNPTPQPLCKVVHYFSIQCQPPNPIQSKLDTDWQKLPIDYQYQ